MSKTVTPRIKLSKLAWNDFLRLVAQHWLWILGFALFLLPLNFFDIREESRMLSTALANVGDMENIGNLSAAMPTEVVSAAGVCRAILQALINVIALYCFTVLCLRQQPIRGVPDFGVQPFCLWVRKLWLPFSLLYFSAIFAWIMEMLSPATDPLAWIGAKILITLMDFLAWGFLTRLMFTFPLAADGTGSVLETSWRLTKGRWWRLVWDFGTYGFNVALLSLFFVGAVALIFILVSSSFDSVATSLGTAMAMSVAEITFDASMAIFTVVACHALYEERRQLDPAFTLG